MGHMTCICNFCFNFQSLAAMNVVVRITFKWCIFTVDAETNTLVYFFINLSCSLHTWLYINVYCIPDRNRLGISLCIWVLNFHYVYVVCCLIIVVHARIMARIRVLLVCLALLLLWIVDCWKLLFHLLTIIPTLTPFRILSVTQWNVSGKKSVKHWVAAACVLFCNPVVMCNSWILWMSVVAKLAIMGLEYYSSVLQVDLQLANSQNGHHFFFYSKLQNHIQVENMASFPKPMQVGEACLCRFVNMLMYSSSNRMYYNYVQYTFCSLWCLCLWLLTWLSG